MGDVLARSTLLGEDVAFVLRITYAGRDFYLSTEPHTITSDAGDIEVGDGLDDVTWEERLEVGATEPGEDAVSISVVMPIDVAAYIARGFDLGAASCELSRWVTGTAWEERQVLAVGAASEPTYGAEGEPVEFSIVTAPYEDLTQIPDAACVVDATTWPSAADGAEGAVYPLVIGRPGLIGSTTIPGSPAPVVHTSQRRILIADRWCRAGTVFICNADEDPTSFTTATIANTVDGRGRRVATAVIPLTGIVWDSADEYWIAWPATGSIPNAIETGPLLYAGQALEALLGMTGLRVDRGRTAAASAYLDGYQVGAYIDERVDVWDWIQSHLLPILPVSIVSGPHGLYPIVWRWGATAQDAVAQIDIDEGDGDRAGPVTYTDRGQVVNEIAIRWGLDGAADEYTQTSTITGDDTVTRDETYWTSARARISRSRYGLRSETVESDVIYDSATAGKVLAWMLDAYGLLARIVSYDLPEDYAYLQLGDVVTLTDSEIGMSRQVCLVVATGDEGDGVIRVTLRTIER